MAAAFTAFCLVIPPVVENVRNGQAYSVLLAVAVIALAAARRDAAPREGVCLGLAAGLKLALPFLWLAAAAGRRRRRLGWATATVAALGAVTLVFTGPGAFAEWLRLAVRVGSRPELAVAAYQSQSGLRPGCSAATRAGTLSRSCRRRRSARPHPGGVRDRGRGRRARGTPGRRGGLRGRGGRQPGCEPSFPRVPLRPGSPARERSRRSRRGPKGHPGRPSRRSFPGPADRPARQDAGRSSGRRDPRCLPEARGGVAARRRLRTHGARRLRGPTGRRSRSSPVRHRNGTAESPPQKENAPGGALSRFELNGGAEEDRTPDL